MKNKIKLILSLLILIAVSCEWAGSVEPKEEPKPPGYQEDIPWPSLADSPWPMYHGNPQSTGRSKFNGPRSGSFHKVFESPELHAGIVIGEDSTIYCASSDFGKGGLYAYSPNGDLKWRVPSRACQAAPLISSDGTIYFSSTSILFAINPDSTIKWQYIYGVDPIMPIIGMNIDLEGNIYFITSNSELGAIDKGGNIIWTMIDSRISWSNKNVIVFSPDGQTIYCMGIKNSVIAIDIQTQMIKWTFGKLVHDWSNSPPIVDSQGHIYVNAIIDSINSENPTIYSLYPNGTIRWALEDENISIHYQPTIDRYGNLYCASDTLYAVDYFGTLKWTISLNGHLGNGLVCDASDIIYACPDKQELLVYAVDKNGNISWKINHSVYGSVSAYTIGYEELYIPVSKQGYFYLIK